MKLLPVILVVLLAGCRTTPEPVPAATPRRVERAPKVTESVQARAERISRWEAGVRMFLGQERDVLRACYDNELRRVEDEAVKGAYRNGEPVPSLAGTLLLVVPIELDGAVREPRIEQNVLANANVDACLLREAKRWNLPAPPVEEVVEIEVPLTFELMTK